VTRFRPILGWVRYITTSLFGIGVILIVPFVIILLLWFFMNQSSKSVLYWPHSDVVTMREMVEKSFPPPPSSHFVNASIIIYKDGDQWKCVEYKSESTSNDIRLYYETLFLTRRWYFQDSAGFFEKRYGWQLSVIHMNGVVRTMPWHDSWFFNSEHPPYSVSFCFAYDSWMH
jgi:hypothetical protein